MIQNFYLMPLQCPLCGAPLEAEEASEIFYCLTCQKGFELRERKYHAYPLNFAAALMTSPLGAIHELPLHLPFWVIEAQIEIMTRQYVHQGPEAEYWRTLYGQLKSFLPGANITTAEEAQSETLHLFIPAFATTNIAAYTTNLGVALTQTQPAFEKGPPALPLPCIYGSQEALALAEIIFMALETRETFNLIRLEFNLKPLHQELWALPFYSQDEFLVEPKTGAKMLAAGLEGKG